MLLLTLLTAVVHCEVITGVFALVRACQAQLTTGYSCYVATPVIAKFIDAVVCQIRDAGGWTRCGARFGRIYLAIERRIVENQTQFLRAADKDFVFIAECSLKYYKKSKQLNTRDHFYHIHTLKREHGPLRSIFDKL